MNDPYSVLGLRPGASKEEIKEAYRELAKKYHPDKYKDNPLSELAEEKMRKINVAYDTITKDLDNNRSNSSYSNAGSYSGEHSTSFMQVRQLINMGRMDEAERILQGMSARNAEWNFLMGMVCMRKGWYEKALEYLQNATNMDPNNMEYRRAYQGLISNAQGYNRTSYNKGYRRSGSSDFCNLCMCLCCADICCR